MEPSGTITLNFLFSTTIYLKKIYIFIDHFQYYNIL